MLDLKDKIHDLSGEDEKGDLDPIHEDKLYLLKLKELNSCLQKRFSKLTIVLHEQYDCFGQDKIILFKSPTNEGTCTTVGRHLTSYFGYE